jgi:nucleotide-binding universal stress UspA family protein
MKLTKILATTDFSKYAGFALEWAAHLAQCMKADLILLHVVLQQEGKTVQEVVRGQSVITYVPTSVEDKVIAERQKQLKEQYDMVVPRELKASLKLEEMVRVGDPFLEIIRVAKEKDVDLIVMGTHGRTGLFNILIGSVAEKVVHYAHCPVLTVKHPQYQFIAPTA